MDAAELRLEVTAGKAAGFILTVQDRLVIGRNSEGPGRLADDPELSRDHAEIARGANGEFTIRDLSSMNGTFVNGTRLHPLAVLRTGDQIEVGGTKLAVRSAPDPATSPRADVNVRAPTVVTDIVPGPRRPAEPGATPGAGVRRAEQFSLRLSIDFERAAAQLSVDGRDEPIRLVFERGHWRIGDHRQ